MRLLKMLGVAVTLQLVAAPAMAQATSDKNENAHHYQGGPKTVVRFAESGLRAAGPTVLSLSVYLDAQTEPTSTWGRRPGGAPAPRIDEAPLICMGHRPCGGIHSWVHLDSGDHQCCDP